MLPIVSRRHILKFYLSIAFVVIFSLTLGFFMIYIFKNDLDKGDMKTKEYFMPIFVVCLFAFGLYTVYKYYKNSPVIQITKEFITFNSETFALSDIKEINLTGKEPFPYLIYTRLESTKIQFKNGIEKIIFDDMYQNSWEIKSFLKNVTAGKSEYIETAKTNIERSELNGEHFETFKGNQFMSLRGISLWSIVIGLTYALLMNKKPISPLAISTLIPFGLFWFFLHSWLMNYFKISSNYFVVKNHNLIWKTKIYRLTDINEIVFETQGKMPNCLRVITKDFRSKLYPAGTLRNKMWLKLKDDLESHKIKVRNECI